MRILLDWLNDYVKTSSTPDKLADSLIMTTAEVEETLDPPVALIEAVAATIIALKPHPQADRLQLATVRIGKATHTVVCGAPNIEVGQRVPYVGPGKHYHTDHGNDVLESATIRGVVSNGMLASAKDIGFGSNHDGIMILPQSAKEGASIAEVVGWQLPTLDLEITPNRSDLLSYVGLAREIAAIEKSRLTMPTIHSLPSHTGRAAVTVSVETALCSRYTATLVTGITNGPSPLWMQARLLAHDINPQNAIVDITNYVMLELGQPLHAFDAMVLRSYGELRISVRTAAKDEQFIGLDGKEYLLTSQDLVIDGGGSAIALAGVIGGNASAVTNSTSEIVIESAVFDPVAVRKTAARHSCRTDAVTRFEKGVDPEMTVVAVKRAVQLIHEICGGEVSGSLADANYQHTKKTQITVSLERAKRVLGVTFGPASAKSLLTKIGFGVSLTSKYELSVLVPSWRNDVEQEEDIFEELIRLGGYDQIQPTLPSGPLCTSVKPTTYTALYKLRSWLVKNGLRELESPAFATDEQLKTYFVASQQPVRIANPTTRNEALYRFSLLPNMIDRAATQSRTESALASFEIGDVATHHKQHVNEVTNLAICILTDNPVTACQRLKGMIDALPKVADRSGTITFGPAKKPWPFSAADPEEIRLGGKVIGQIGVLTQALTTKAKIRGERYLLIAELGLDQLIAADSSDSTYREPHRYPVVTRDITVEIDQATKVGTLINDLKQAGVAIVKQLDVVDYHPTKNGPNVTFRAVMYDDHTLTDQEVTAAVDQLSKLLNSKTR